MHSGKCKFYTERIAFLSSSKELHQIVNILSNRHPPKILPTIYPSADLPSIFIKHFTNKVEKLRANIASEHVTSTLVTGTTAAAFSSCEKMSNKKMEFFKSSLVALILKRKCLDHNDLNNYRPVSNLCFIAKILEKLVLSQVSSYLNSQSLQYLSISISSRSQHLNSSSESC